MKIFKKTSKFIQQNLMVCVLHKGKYIKMVTSGSRLQDRRRDSYAQQLLNRPVHLVIAKLRSSGEGQ